MMNFILAVSDFAKAHDDRPVFKVGILDQKVLEAADVQRLAKLPPKEQLLAELAGALEAPNRRTRRACSGAWRSVWVCCCCWLFRRRSVMCFPAGRCCCGLRVGTLPY